MNIQNIQSQFIKIRKLNKFNKSQLISKNNLFFNNDNICIKRQNNKTRSFKISKRLSIQYDKYVKHKNVYELGFKYSSDDIEDFMYRCIDLKEDVMRKTENMFFVFDDLMITIIKERNLHNS